MPKSISYKTNSVIYFKGDRTSHFYVLKAGKVAVTSADDVNSSNDDNRRVISAGEFFGVRAALSGYAQDETAIALMPSEIIALTHSEFERVATQNGNIILKLLKVYSKQLSDVHEKVKDAMSKKGHAEQINEEEGLYGVGLYFLRNRLYRQCVEAFKRYLKNYPNGDFAAEAKAKIEYSESRIGSTDDAHERFFPGNASGVEQAATVSEAEQFYQEAKALFDGKKYAQSVLKFGRIIRETDSSYQPFVPDSSYLMCEALFNLQKFSDVIEELTGFFQKYPESENTQKALYLMARSYEALNDKALALIFYQKLYDILPEDSPLKPRIKSILKK